MKANPFFSGTRISRRESLSLGAGAAFLGSLGLPAICRLRAESAAAAGAGAESGDIGTTVILVNLGGGPSQFETYDPQPEAPSDVRGSFGTIATSVAGVRFCELLPQQAKRMDRLAIVRSIHHEQASHIAEHIIETGYDLRNSLNSLRGEMPSVGSIVSAVRGPSPDGIPAYVTLPDRKAYSGAHWLGGQHRRFAVNEDPNAPDFKVKDLSLARNLDLDRLADRRTLRADLDRAQHAVEYHANADSMDFFTRQAFELVTGPNARDAFDVSAESDTTRDRYGRNPIGQRMLLARRLAEAEVPYIKVRIPGWDDHKDLPKRITPRAAEYHTALAALLDDLRDSGLSRQVLVVAMGEFGRTPRINGSGGRDHWPGASSVLIAGGDYRMGQVIGATDSTASTVVEAPYRPQNVLTMMYRHLGIDPAITFEDYSGRPRYALEERGLITELL